MKTTNLSIKELAAIIGVSTDTFTRTVRKNEIPATRVRTVLRFDLHKVDQPEVYVPPTMLVRSSQAGRFRAQVAGPRNCDVDGPGCSESSTVPS